MDKPTHAVDFDGDEYPPLVFAKSGACYTELHWKSAKTVSHSTRTVLDEIAF